MHFQEPPMTSCMEAIDSDEHRAIQTWQHFTER